MENAESSPTGRPLSEERAAISLDVVRLGILGTGYGLMFAASNERRTVPGGVTWVWRRGDAKRSGLDTEVRW